jgi:hypothetical protein
LSFIAGFLSCVDVTPDYLTDKRLLASFEVFRIFIGQAPIAGRA